jgi:hypothetical protein
MRGRIETALENIVRRQPAQVAENEAPPTEVDVPGYPRDILEGVDPDAPPTDQYLGPIRPGEEDQRGPGYFTNEQRQAYLDTLGSGRENQNQPPYPYYPPEVVPPVTPPPPAPPPPGSIVDPNWFNMARINSPYTTMVPTPLLQTAPVSTGVGTLLPNIVVVNPFA